MGEFNDPFFRNKDAAVQGRTKSQNRANVLQLKMMGQGHPTGLTQSLLRLFEPRPLLEYRACPEKAKCPEYTGMAQYVSQFAEPGDKEYAPPAVKGETKAEKKARIHKLQLEKGAEKAAEELKKYDPFKDPKISGDAFKTLFVARLNYETTEHMVKREFEAYGPIKRVRLVTDKKTNKPRGYAFVEYMHTRHMTTAYKQADGKKLDNKRVLVDVERGRTVPKWRPRRLGGGLGSTRIGGQEVGQKHSGREQQVASGPSRSEEPRVRDDQSRDMEKSRERSEREQGKDKHRGRTHDRVRDNDPREDRHRHHRRDRDKYEERDRERDSGHERDRVHSRDTERDRGRDYDRERERDLDRPQEQERERVRDPDRATRESDRGYRRGKDVDYDHIEKGHDKERPAVKEMDVDHDGRDYVHERYNEPIKHGRRSGYNHNEQSQNQEHYEHLQPHGLTEPEHSGEPSKRHEPEYYGRDPYNNLHLDHFQGRPNLAEPEPLEEGEAVDDDDIGYQRSKRSLSRDYHD